MKIGKIFIKMLFINKDFLGLGVVSVTEDYFLMFH